MGRVAVLFVVGVFVMQVMPRAIAQQASPPTEKKTTEAISKEEAWRLIQTNRNAYTAKQSLAYAALNGNQQTGKPPDLNAAIQAANQAAENILDGSQVTFAPSQGGGVTATVKPRDGKPQQLRLSVDAFRRYLNVGRDGQWDKLMGETVPKTLQRLAREPAQMANDWKPPIAPSVAPQFDPRGSAVAMQPVPEKTSFGKTPSTMNITGSDKVQYGSMEQVPYGQASAEDRANRMFPGGGQASERAAYIDADYQQKSARQHQIDLEAMWLSVQAPPPIYPVNGR